jgi:hypothetical protein
LDPAEAIDHPVEKNGMRQEGEITSVVDYESLGEKARRATSRLMGVSVSRSKTKFD